jgi:molybdenum cofactor biosynthesis protein B
MVDFQSRSTPHDDEEDGDADTPEPDEPPEDDTAAVDHEPATEDDHDHHHHDATEVGAAVVTVSSTRSLSDDPGGDAVAAAFESEGHEVVTRELVDDSYDRVQGAVDNLVGRRDVDVVVTTGGTGVTPDDITVEAVETLFDKELPGFGEVFRSLSFQDIGTKVVGTRATAGVVDRTLVFCLPGSEHAARLGTEDVILPEIEHLVGLAARDDA